jgi:hypothetical protein
MKILFISPEYSISLYYCTTICLKWTKNIETYPYVVDKKYDTFETTATRQVCLRLSNSTKEFKEASSQGFSILAGYILEEIKRMKK